MKQRDFFTFNLISLISGLVKRSVKMKHDVDTN